LPSLNVKILLLVTTAYRPIRKFYISEQADKKRVFFINTMHECSVKWLYRGCSIDACL